MAYDRNLASINRKLLKGSTVLQDAVRERLAPGRQIAVLEVGCGLGVALLELAWLFRTSDVRFCGINRDRGEPLQSREDLRATARQIGLAPDAELTRFDLPEIFFEDATTMHVEEESFDVVYASSVLRFVPRKVELLETIARVLRPGGVALIRVGGKGWDYSYGPASGGDELTPHAARWVLKHADALIPLDTYLTSMAGDGWSLEFINRPNCVIRLQKRCRGVLRFDLQYVPQLSVPLKQLGYGDQDRGLAKGGIRSVYDVSDARHRQLLERGLLTQRGASAGGSAAVQADRHVPIGGALHPTRPAKPSRLASYRVGQRINVKGRRRGRRFVAAKIKMIHYPSAQDHLEGPLEWVDADRGRLGVLGVAASAGHGDQAPDLNGVTPGAAVRVCGRAEPDGFLAMRIDPVPPAAIVVEEIQAPIQAIEAVGGTLQVAGISIVTDSATKIDRQDAR